MTERLDKIGKLEEFAAWVADMGKISRLICQPFLRDKSYDIHGYELEERKNGEKPTEEEKRNFREERNRIRSERKREHKQKQRVEKRVKITPDPNVESVNMKMRARHFSQISEQHVKIAIDFGMAEEMSVKERDKLQRQIDYILCSNRKAAKPVRLILSNLAASSALHRLCCAKNSNFLKYPENAVLITAESPYSLIDNVVVMSSEADQPLEALETDTIYIIGGLLDENRNKPTMLNQAKEKNVPARRLPIIGTEVQMNLF